MSLTLLSILKSWVTAPSRVFRWMMLARPIRFTRFGTFYILFCIGVGAAAINTGNNLLYLILGIQLGFIVISGLLSDSAHWGIQSTWSPGGSFYVGQPTTFDIELTKGRFPGVAITVEALFGPRTSDAVKMFVPWIPSRGSTSAQVTVTPRRRGRFRLTRCTYSTYFPFGLFRKSHTEEREERWIAYPAIQPLQLERLQSLGIQPASTPQPRVGHGSTPFLLRDYREGDALRHVHWKVSAKRQRLMVKEMEEESGNGDIYSLEAWPVGLTENRMEDLVSFMASLFFHMHRVSRPVGLSTPDVDIAPECSRSHLHRVMEYLALVDPFHPTASPLKRMKGTGVRQVDLVALWRSYGSAR